MGPHVIKGIQINTTVFQNISMYLRGANMCHCHKIQALWTQPLAGLNHSRTRRDGIHSRMATATFCPLLICSKCCCAVGVSWTMGICDSIIRRKLTFNIINWPLLAPSITSVHFTVSPYITGSVLTPTTTHRHIWTHLYIHTYLLHTMFLGKSIWPSK